MSTDTPYRLAWLRLDAASKRFLLEQPRTHAAFDAVAKPDRLAHHITLWYGGACGPFADFGKDFPIGWRVHARPIGIAVDHRVEALVVEVVNHQFQHGSNRLLHVTLSLAAGIAAEDSVRLLSTTPPPALRHVDWPDLFGEVEYILPPSPSATSP